MDELTTKYEVSMVPAFVMLKVSSVALTSTTSSNYIYVHHSRIYHTSTFGKKVWHGARLRRAQGVFPRPPC